MLQNLGVSLIRTYVPIAVGLLLTWLAESTHLVISPKSEALLAGVAVAVLSAAYYSLVRLLEHYVPQLGVLLGVPKKPVYPSVASVAAALVPELGVVTFDPADQPVDAIPADPAPVAAPPTA